MWLTLALFKMYRPYRGLVQLIWWIIFISSTWRNLILFLSQFLFILIVLLTHVIKYPLIFGTSIRTPLIWKISIVKAITSFTFNWQTICMSNLPSCRTKKKNPSSDSHSSSPFCLIHVDIWGPCHITSLNGHKYTIMDGHSRLVWIFLMKSKVETQSLLPHPDGAKLQSLPRRGKKFPHLILMMMSN